MEKYLKKIKTIREQLVSESEKRDQVFLGRTESWQRSGKGVTYEINTQLIADAVEGLDTAIYNLELTQK